MDFILISFIVLILIGVRPCVGGWSKQALLEQGIKFDYLSVDNTTPLRGILAITIILHHMAERVEGGMIFPLLLHAGYLGVGLFFFLSGYGLMLQYKRKGKVYLQGFWKKRIGYLVVVYLIATVFYAIVEYMIGKEITVQQVLLSLVNGRMTVSNSWYIYIQIALYIIFWFAFKYVKDRRKAILLAFVLETSLVPLIVLWGQSGIWYISNYPFVVGLIWAEEKESIDLELNNRWGFWLTAFTVAFAVFSAIPLIARRMGMPSDYIYTVCRMISVPLLAVLCIIILNKVWIKSKVWSFLGKISLEIYILHGLVIMFLRSDVVYVHSDVLWTVLTVLITVGMAYVANILNKRIGKKLRG